MNFLAPLGFLFALSLPVVVVFYLLKRKRVVRVVPSTVIWQKFLAETQASAPFQRLRHNWLLLLQLLMLLLAVLALARPYFSGKTTGGRILVTVLDSSASMQATDETPSRFEKARKQALSLVDSLSPDDQMAVLQAGANTEVKQSATSEKAALRRAIEDAKVTDSTTRLNEALKLAQTLSQNNVKAEIHLFSDGATGSLEEFENKGLPLVFHKVGQRGVNLGVVNLDVKSNPDNPAQRAVFATVYNASTNASETRVELLLDGKVLDVKNLSLKAGESSPQVFLANQDRDGVFTVRLDGQDDLAADNQASVVSLLPQPVKVLLATTGNRFLEKALKAIPTIELTKTDRMLDAPSEFDVVVLDGVAPLSWPTASILAIHVAPTNLFNAAARVESPPIVDWKNGHSLLRFVNFDNVQIGESMSVALPSWAVSLVESPTTPLVLAGELKSQRVVWIGFDTLQSTWPLRISFPIFVANAMDWLNPAAERASRLSIQAGDPFRLGLPDATGEAEITLPDGSKRTRAIDTSKKELLFGDTHRQGIYQIKAGTNQVTFCVNLLDAAETRIEPKAEIMLGQYARVTQTTTRQANLEIWRWIALTALFVLLFEWWYYHKRTA